MNEAAVAVAGRDVRRAVWVAAAVYAVALTTLSWLRYEAFLPESDLGVFAQLVWLMGHLHDPFSTVALRPMLADHWEPSVVLLAPLGSVGVGTVGVLVLQSLALALAAPLLYTIARLAGARGWVAAVPAILWLCSPIVIRANLWEFHPDALVALLLVLCAYAALTERTALFVVTALIALGFKEDAGLTFAALGLVLVWTGRRRLGVPLLVGSAALAVALNFVVMPRLWPAGRRLYTERFVGDRGSSFGDAVRFWLTHPLATLGDVATLRNLAIVAILIATSGGLCFLAPRWLLVAAPSVALNLLSAYEGQHTLKYQYWLVPAAAVALAGAIGAGRVPDRLTTAVRAGAVAVAAGLLVISLVSVVRIVEDVRDEWPHRDDRRAIVDAIPADAVVSAPLRFLPPLAGRRELYTFPVPFVQAVTESDWSPADLAAARNRLDYVVFDPTLTRNPETLAEVRRAGFVAVMRRGTTVLYRAPEGR